MNANEDFLLGDDGRFHIIEDDEVAQGNATIQRSSNSAGTGRGTGTAGNNRRGPGRPRKPRQETPSITYGDKPPYIDPASAYPFAGSSSISLCDFEIQQAIKFYNGLQKVTFSFADTQRGPPLDGAIMLDALEDFKYLKHLSHACRLLVTLRYETNKVGNSAAVVQTHHPSKPGEKFKLRITKRSGAPVQKHFLTYIVMCLALGEGPCGKHPYLDSIPDKDTKSALEVAKLLGIPQEWLEDVGALKNGKIVGSVKQFKGLFHQKQSINLDSDGKPTFKMLLANLLGLDRMEGWDSRLKKNARMSAGVSKFGGPGSEMAKKCNGHKNKRARTEGAHDDSDEGSDEDN